jgi:uncharacterized repeat protein (TIGR03803 family)
MSEDRCLFTGARASAPLLLKPFACLAAMLAAMLVFLGATAIASPAPTFTTLFAFNGSDGVMPNSLVQGLNGDLYSDDEQGDFFSITTSGVFKPIGLAPDSNVVGPMVYPNGDFFMAAPNGEENGGEIVRVTPAGKTTDLYNFCENDNCAHGEHPFAGLVEGTNGNLYGTTARGGAGDEGTVFEVSPTSKNKITLLYSFCVQAGCPDGSTAYYGLVLGTDGNFYGTTNQGGTNNLGTILQDHSRGGFDNAPQL